MLTQVSLMPLITMPHVHGGQRGAECSSGQRGWSGLIRSGSGLSLIWSVSSRIVGTEAIMVKGVVMSGRIASDLVFIA
jgi:hypothetical protein